jgi:hypothetical protein
VSSRKSAPLHKCGGYVNTEQDHEIGGCVTRVGAMRILYKVLVDETEDKKQGGSNMTGTDCV